MLELIVKILFTFISFFVISYIIAIFILVIFFLVIRIFFKDKIKIYNIICPYCGKETIINMKEKHCYYCHNLIEFVCSLCGKKDIVDGYDMYDLLHNDKILLCKKCKGHAIGGRYIEYKIKLSKLEIVADILWGFINSSIIKLLVVISLLLILINTYYCQSLYVAMFIPLVLFILAAISFTRKKYFK